MYKYVVHDTLLDEVAEFKTAKEVAAHCDYSSTSLGHYFSVYADKICFEGHDAQIVVLGRSERYTIIRWRA